MVTNYITTEEDIDVGSMNKKIYQETCQRNLDIISNISSLDKNYIMNYIMKSKRCNIRDMISKSLKCVLNGKIKDEIVKIIENKGYTEIEYLYPLKIDFESGLLNISIKNKLVNNFEKKIKSRYITEEYYTNMNINFLAIREKALSSYERGEYLDAIEKIKYLLRVVPEDYILDMYIANIYAFYFKDFKNAIESYKNAVSKLKDYNFISKEISQIFYVIGCLYLYNNEYENAEEFLAKASYIYKDTEYIYKLAQCYSLMGDSTKCIETIEKLLNENIYYAIEIQFCHNFYPMSKIIKKFIEDMNFKFTTIYMNNLKQAEESISEININMELEGTEDIKEELVKLKSKLLYNETDFCLVYTYKNSQIVQNYKVISEAYKQIYVNAIKIKNRINIKSEKLKDINYTSNENQKSIMEDKLKNLIKKYDDLEKIEIKYRHREKIWRKIYNITTFSIASSIFIYFKFDLVMFLILYLGWLLGLAFNRYLKIFEKCAQEVACNRENLKSDIYEINKEKLQQWEEKRKLEKAIKKDICFMCTEYNYLLNERINDVNVKLGLNLGEVKINFV